MNNTTLKVVEWDIDKLIGAEYNPRKLSEEQKQTIKDSINRFGLVDPVIVNTSKERNGIIIGGHQRTKVAREMGFEKMPCVELDLSIDQEKELNVRLNKNTGSWDNDILSDLFQKDELIEWGFGEDELEFFEPEEIEAVEDEFDGELPTEPQTVLGDLYELNGHRVHCASSTEIDAVEKLMDGKKADMVFTDPPYGVDYKGQIESMNYNGSKGKKREIILNDKNTNSIIDFMPLMKKFCDGVAYIFCGAGKELDLLQSIKENKYEMINTLIWNKPKGTLALGANYKPCFELFYYIKIQGDRNWSGNNAEWTVWNIEYKKDNTLHPTQKPIELINKALKNHKNKSLIDFFLGSGTSLISAEQNKMICYGQELDPKYCDVIVKRWVKFMKDNGKSFTVKRNGADVTKDKWLYE